MNSYLSLLKEVLEEGEIRPDRTGVGTQSLFGRQLRFDLREGFPLLTTKKVHFKSVIHELLWFVRGETHVRALQAAGVRIWDEWATPEQTARFGREAGDLGPIYGHQWRNFAATKDEDGTYRRDGVDQLAQLVENLRARPESRRHIVTGWHPREADEVALPPCHTLFQCYVHGLAGTGEKPRLSVQLYQRSADIFLGVPFNIASYAALTLMLAKLTGMEPKELIISYGDVHLYENHRDQAKLQLGREPRALPTLKIGGAQTALEGFQYDDFRLEGYDPHPRIPAPVAV